MTEKEKMNQNKIYNANNDQELLNEMLQCKALCQEYNDLPIKDLEKRNKIIKTILGKTGSNIRIEPNFWCDYGYRIEIGENFYANHGLVILDAGTVKFGDNIFIGPYCGFYTSGHPIDFERRNMGLEYAYPITIGNNIWFGAGVHVMPGVTIGDNVVIGAGSIVVKNIPSNTVAFGNPCNIIREINEEDKNKSWDR